MWHPESIFDASGHLDEGVVHAWLDDQLAPGAATQVEQHAAACAACSAMVAEARGLIAGASRVMASLDEPAVGQAPSRDALLGIVTAAGAARAPAAPPARTNVRRWSTRRISVLAAAALVFVTGTLVLRDSGTVREMVQADQQAVSDSTGMAESAQPEPAQALESVPEAADATAGQAAAPLVGRAAVPNAGSSAGAVGGVSGNAVATRAQPEPTSPPPSPVATPAPAASRPAAKAAPEPAPLVVSGATSAMTRRGTDRGQDRASDEAVVGREAVVTRDMAAGRVEAQAADERRRLQPSAAQAPQAAFAETRQSVVRTSAEIHAMVRMVSSCWRIADSDSVLELLPPGSRSGAPGAREAASAWIPGWLRIGTDATNPDRIWWLPLPDSASARVRLDDRASPDLVITPGRESGRLWRVARADSIGTWASIPRGEAAESATSARCPLP